MSSNESNNDALGDYKDFTTVTRRRSRGPTRSVQSIPLTYFEYDLGNLPSNLGSAKALSSALSDYLQPSQMASIVDLRFKRDGTVTVVATTNNLRPSLKLLSAITGKTIKITEAYPRMTNNKRNNPKPTFSCVICKLDDHITPAEVEQHLTVACLDHVRVWRIKSAATKRDTPLMRVLTKSQDTVDTLLRDGFDMFHCWHHVEPSHPSKSQPLQYLR